MFQQATNTHVLPELDAVSTQVILDSFARCLRVIVNAEGRALFQRLKARAAIAVAAADCAQVVGRVLRQSLRIHVEARAQAVGACE